ncbi:MAG: PcfB family protein [Acutalibacteraceae bacterium]|nr:PcfB family protein [Acutalibacteraceae bacterium]
MSAGEQVISLVSKAGLMTLQTILKEIEKMNRNRERIAEQVRREQERAASKGEQSLESLSSKNVSVDSIPVSNVDIRQMQEALKEYGVDFAVVKNRNTQDFNLYFKATDSKIILDALEQVVNDLDMDKDLLSDKTEQNIEPLDVQKKEFEEKADKLAAEKKAEKAFEQDIKKNMEKEQSL